MKTVEASARMAEAKPKLDDRITRAEHELKKAEKVAADVQKKLNELRACH